LGLGLFLNGIYTNATELTLGACVMILTISSTVFAIMEKQILTTGTGPLSGAINLIPNMSLVWSVFKDYVLSSFAATYFISLLISLLIVITLYYTDTLFFNLEIVSILVVAAGACPLFSIILYVIKTIL
jgi:hypothetical protein